MISHLNHPDVNAWQFHQAIRALRGNRTAATVAADLGWSESKLTRLETVSQAPKPAAVRQLLDHYDAPADTRTRIMNLVAGARQPSPWADCETLLPPGSLTYIGFELVAETLRVCAPHSVPSVLQTAEYAAANLRTRMTLTDEQAHRCAGIHEHRQDRLDRDDQLHVWAIIDESVLHRTVGNPATMRRQAQRLIELAGRGTVNLQILPLSRGLHDGRTPFAVFDTADNIGLEIVCADTAIGLDFIRDQRVLRYRHVFERLIASALPVGQSTALIEKLLSDPLWLSS